MIVRRCIKTKSVESRLFSKAISEDGKRYLHLAPPFLLDDYEPVALDVYKAGILKVVSLL